MSSGLALEQGLDPAPSLPLAQRAMVPGFAAKLQVQAGPQEDPAVSPQHLGGCPLATSDLQLNGLICIKVLLTILGLGGQICYF